MFKITVNETHTFTIGEHQGSYTLDGTPLEIDMLKRNDRTQHILLGNRSYNTEILDYDAASKQARVRVNGSVYSVSVKDKFDLLLDALGMSGLNAGKVTEVKAPMPGLVLQVLVAAGQEVKKGDNLLVLEAMKMENMLKSPADGKIRLILAEPGNKVEKNAVLIAFE